MRTSRSLFALSSLALFFTACGGDEGAADGTGGMLGTEAGGGGAPLAGTGGSDPLGGGAPGAGAGPVAGTPAVSGGTGGMPVAGSTAGAAGTSTAGGATAGVAGSTAGGAGAPMGGTATDGGGAGMETAGSGPEAGSGNPDPNTPPEGAYVACSGDPLPAMKATTVLEDLDNPIFATTPEKDPNMMFVVERGGALLRFDLSQSPPTRTELLKVTTSIGGGECGFLSAALHPNFDGETEGRIYVSYTPTCGNSVFAAGTESGLDEYVVSGDAATFAKSLFSDPILQPQSNHNGGQIAFGPDGYLYLGLGDGGQGDDSGNGHSPNGNGQDPNSPFGKLLRFDVDNLDTPPAGNLTSEDVGGASVDGRIIHMGFRNPWRFSFDRLTGDLYVADVGQAFREEVDLLPAGSRALNMGWAAREGFTTCPSCGAKTVLQGTTAMDPIYDYCDLQHSSYSTSVGTVADCPTSGPGAGATASAIIGGYVYRGQAIPAMYGRYIYSDYQSGILGVFTSDGQGGSCDVTVDVTIQGANIGANMLSSFAQDSAGNIYLINMLRGSIARLDPQ